MKCKICHKEIKRGEGYKGERFKSEHFCCEECYNERVKQSNERRAELSKNNYNAKNLSDYNRLTAYIKSAYGESANLKMLMSQVKNIKQEYGLTDKDLIVIIKYAQTYEDFSINTDYGIYQFVPFIYPARQFKDAFYKNREIELSPEEEIVVTKKSSNKRKWHGRGLTK